MSIIEKIMKLMEESGLSAHALEIKSGIAISSIQAWKNGKAKPSVDAIIKIAKYFNISADYLLGTEPTAEDKEQGFVPLTYLTAEKQELLMYFDEIGDRLGSEAQKGLITYAKFIAEGSK